MWGWSTPVSAWLLHGTGDMRLLQWVPLPPKFHVLPHGILCRACPQRSYGSLIMHECAGKGGGGMPLPTLERLLVFQEVLPFLFPHSCLPSCGPEEVQGLTACCLQSSLC